jgi:pilus assembly protein CpaB
MRKKLPLIIGIVLALMASFLIKVYTDQQHAADVAEANRKLAKIQSEQVSILVAAKDLPKGAMLDKDSVAAMIISNQYVQPQAATSLDRVSGMIAAVPISRGEQITLNKFISAREVTSSGNSLAMVTPIGKRAVTIPIDSISAVGGMIRPGDYVDVVAMLTVPALNAQGKKVTQVTSVSLFQNVLVLAIGQDISTVTQQPAVESRYKKEERKVEAASITLALNPKDANLLGFVQDQGKIRLALRSPADAKIEPMQSASWDSLFQYLMPPELIEARDKQAKEAKPESYVEVYRGSSKEKVSITNK